MQEENTSRVSKDLGCEREDRGKQQHSGEKAANRADTREWAVWGMPRDVISVNRRNAFTLVPASEGSHYRAWTLDGSNASENNYLMALGA